MSSSWTVRQAVDRAGAHGHGDSLRYVFGEPEALRQFGAKFGLAFVPE